MQRQKCSWMETDLIQTDYWNRKETYLRYKEMNLRDGDLFVASSGKRQYAGPYGNTDGCGTADC